MKAGRGYIIRFFDEKNNTALFYARQSKKNSFSYGRTTPWAVELKTAAIFKDHEEAVKTVVEIKKATKKKYKKGYLYIAKAFYKEEKTNTWGTKETMLTATRLTKPDRHDFLQAI